MIPREFIERIEGQPYVDAGSLFRALSQPASVSIRINPYKWDASCLNYEKVPWEGDGFYLNERPMFTPDPLFHAGVYYPQEASGMFTGEFVRQVTAGADNLRILDLCGAPGGKSTHISSVLGQRGLLVANEVIRPRAAVLAENITKWGLGNTMVTQNDPSSFSDLAGFFDVIVVDAPCSGEGMFHDAVALREWSPANAQLCSDRQRRIVMDVWPALRTGGVLIYSTCTFNPAENEENIEWLAGQTGAEPVEADISSFPGIVKITHRSIAGYGFHPGRVRGDGFFIAALRKTGRQQPGSQRMKTGVAARIPSRLAEQVDEIVRGGEERIAFYNNRLLLLAADPGVHNFIETRLNIIKSGTMIGELKNNDFIPAHDLAMSVNLVRGSFPETDLTHEQALAFLRYEEMKPVNLPVGRILMTHRGIPLGFANNLGRRINNGYPRSWRIKMQKIDNFTPVL